MKTKLDIVRKWEKKIEEMKKLGDIFNADLKNE